MATKAISSNIDALKIIESSTKTLPKYTEMVGEIIKSIATIEKMDFNPKDFAKSKISKMSQIVDIYLDCVNQVIHAFIQKGSINPTAEKLLKFFENDQVDGSGQKSTGYAVIDATIQMNKLIGGVYDVIDSVINSDKKFFKAYLKLLISGGRIRKYIEMMIQLIVKVLSNLDTKALNRVTSNKKGTGSVVELVAAVEKIFDSVERMGKTVGGGLFLKRSQRFVIRLFSVVDTIVSQCKSLSKKTLTEKGSLQLIARLKSIRKIVNILGILAGTLLLTAPIFAAFALISPLLVVSIIALVWAVKNILTSVSFLKGRKMTKGLLALAAILGILISLAGVFVLLTIVSKKIYKDMPYTLLLLIGILSLVGMIWLITKVTNQFVKARTVKGLTILVFIMGIMILLGSAVALLTYIAKPIVKGLGSTILMMLSMVAIVGITVAIGVLASTIYPIIKVARLGIIQIGLLVLSILAVTVMLKLIEMIKLDRERILENVTTVVSVAICVISSIFDALVGSPKGAKVPWYEKILHFVGGTVGAMVKSIMSISILATTVVAVFAITLIAAQLRILQVLKLDGDRIRTNVGVVLDIAKSITTQLFASSSVQNNPAEKGFFRSVLLRIGHGFASVIEAIMSVAFLASTVVSVLLIMFIATQLRLLQVINLKPDRIKSNVGLIIDTAKSIITQIFGEGEEPNKSSTKSFFKSILYRLGGNLSSLVDAIMSVTFLASTVVSVLLIMFIATQLRLLQVINLKPDRIRTNVRMIIDTAKSVISQIFGPREESTKPSVNGFFKSILYRLGGFSSLIDAIMSVAFLASALVSVTLITFMAGELRVLQVINLEPDKIKSNVGLIIDTARSIIDQIFAPSDKPTNQTQNGFFRSILSRLGKGPIVSLVGSIMSIAFLASSIVSILLVTFIAGELKLLQSIDLDPVKVGSNVKTVIDTAKGVISQITAKDETKPEPQGGIFRRLLSWVMPVADDLLDAITAIGFVASSISSIGMLIKIAKKLEEVQKINDVSGVSKVVDAVVSSSKYVISSISGFDSSTKIKTDSIEKKLTVLTSINDLISNFGAVSRNKLTMGERVLTEYRNFLTRIDNMDLQKLILAKDLIEQMSKFAESINGDFQGLADTLNEDITPTLKDLKDVLAKTRTAVKDAKDTVAAVSNLGTSTGSGGSGGSSDPAALKFNGKRSLSVEGTIADDLKYIRFLLDACIGSNEDGDMAMHTTSKNHFSAGWAGNSFNGFADSKFIPVKGGK